MLQVPWRSQPSVSRVSGNFIRKLILSRQPVKLTATERAWINRRDLPLRKGLYNISNSGYYWT